MPKNPHLTWHGTLLIGTLCAMGLAPAAWAQTAPPDPKPTPPQTAVAPTPAQLPVNVDKIRTALDRPQPIRINDQNLRFYAEIHPPEVSFMSLVGDFDLMKGAVPGAGVTGREILDMQTPRELYSSAGITATDMLQFAATNYAAQSLIKKAVEEIRQAKDQKEVAAIQAKIDRQLAALMATDKNKAP